MAINYTEKGPWLHEEIANQGHSLSNLNGEWVADDEEAVQAIIDSFDPWPYSAKEAKDAIDEAAGAARARYITTVPGQESTYMTKEQEARQYLADGTVGPMLQAEADATGKTVDVIANEIVTVADQWAQLGAQIEALRMAGKKQVDEAPWDQHRGIVETVVNQLNAI